MSYIISMRKAMEWLSYLWTLLSAYFLFGAATVVCSDILLRRTYGTSLAGADELSGYALAGATAGALGYTLLKRRHIRIDVFYRMFSIRTRAFLDAAACISMVMVASLLLWAGGRELAESFSFGVVANTPWRTPIWIPQALWVLGLLMFFLSAVIASLETLAKMAAGDMPGAHELSGIPNSELEQ